MNFWKTSVFATIATAARLVSQFVVAKLIAIYAGPSAFGLYGQFQSFVSLVQLGSGGVIQNGVLKYSATFHDQPKQLLQLIGTSTKLAFYASLVTGLMLAIFSKWLSILIFQNSQYDWLLITFGLTLFGYTLNQLFLSLLNGLNQMIPYTWLAIWGAMISVLVIGTLTYFYHQNGVLLGFVLSQLTLFFVSLCYIKCLPVDLKRDTFKIDPDLLRKLLKFAVMSIVSAIMAPVSQMIVRRYVADHAGWTGVGYWDGVLKISNAYLLVITTVISTYTLPKYARILQNFALRKEVWSLLYKIVPVVMLSAFLIYILRHYIILILFSPKFLPMEALFFYQFVGDVLKIASWIVANTFLAKEKIKTFVTLEIAFTLSFIVFSILFFNLYGLVGLMIAFAINYFLYLITVLILFFGMTRYEP